MGLNVTYNDKDIYLYILIIEMEILMGTTAIRATQNKVLYSKEILKTKAANGQDFLKKLNLNPRQYLTFKKSAFHIVSRANTTKIDLVDSNEKSILGDLSSILGSTAKELSNEKGFLAAVKNYQNDYNRAVDKGIIKGKRLVADSKAGQKTLNIIIKHGNIKKILNPEKAVKKTSEFDPEKSLKIIVSKMSSKSIIYPSKLAKKMNAAQLKKLLTYIAEKIGKTYDEIKTDSSFKKGIEAYQANYNSWVTEEKISDKQIKVDGYAGIGSLSRVIKYSFTKKPAVDKIIKQEATLKLMVDVKPLELLATKPIDYPNLTSAELKDLAIKNNDRVAFITLRRQVVADKNAVNYSDFLDTLEYWFDNVNQNEASMAAGSVGYNLEENVYNDLDSSILAKKAKANNSWAFLELKSRLRGDKSEVATKQYKSVLRFWYDHGRKLDAVNYSRLMGWDMEGEIDNEQYGSLTAQGLGDILTSNRYEYKAMFELLNRANKGDLEAKQELELTLDSLYKKSPSIMVQNIAMLIGHEFPKKNI